MKPLRIATLVLPAVLAVAALACAAPAASPPPTSPSPSATTPATPTPTPTPAPSLTPLPSSPVSSVLSPAQAAALVFASDERWARMSPLRSDMVGQSSWYEAFVDGDGFAVNITVGQGDCFAGCIERHTWSYRVDATGAVELVSEDGDDVQVEQPAGGDGPALLTIQLTAGPTCPVEQIPPDPDCGPRAVEDADVVVFDADGIEVARDTSDDDGMASFDLPGGAYFVEVEAVKELMVAPEAQAFAFLGGDQVELLFAYDTGIR